MTLTWIGLLLAWPIGSTLLCAAYFRRTLQALWYEPVFCRPVLVFESDDWGPGDETHALALQRLADVLAEYHDSEGRYPVATLGVVLAVADTARIRAADVTEYFRTTLAEHAAVHEAIMQGVARDVFALQLHGMEHYWPASLMALAWRNPDVKAWLSSEGLPRTERLPAALQSRWIDAAKLPSRAHTDAEIETAVCEEVVAFRSMLNATPMVVVPPTFVWSPTVERAWAQQGVRVVITPGRRYTARDRSGKPVPDDNLIVNGMRSETGVMYLVRDDYFEPARGHTAARALRALTDKTVLARPTLLEMHRYNFVDEAEATEHAYAEIKALLEGALAAHPHIAFITPAALAELIEQRDPDWLEQRTERRLHVWAERVRAHYSLWRWTRYTGLGLLVWLLRSITSRASHGVTA